jgi:hypothetical protein
MKTEKKHPLTRRKPDELFFLIVQILIAQNPLNCQLYFTAGKQKYGAEPPLAGQVLLLKDLEIPLVFKGWGGLAVPLFLAILGIKLDV